MERQHHHRQYPARNWSLNNIRYIGQRPFEKQAFRKNPETGKRHAFLNTEDKQQQPISVPELRIVSDELWKAVKERQAQLSAGPRSTIQKEAAKRPFWEQQRPRYLQSNKMTCGECGSAYAKSGKHRFGCMGSAKKGEVYCSNRLSVRQDELDRRVLAGLEQELMQEDVLRAFQQEYAAELARLNRQNDSLRPDYQREHGEVSAKLANLKAAILKGVDPTLFVEEMNQLQGRQRYLDAELATRDAPPDAASIVLRPDLAHIYRARLAR